jgi:hypothetical protein
MGIMMMMTEAKKIVKYKDLPIEIQYMWNINMQVLPVIIGANETISKSLRKYVSNILGKPEIKELQITAILRTNTHTLVSTNVKVQNIQHGN